MTFSAANTIWVLLGAALVFFMQAGFAMCEAGFTRAKNTPQVRGAIRSQVILELEQRKAAEIITDYGEVTVEELADNPTVCLVTFSFTAAHGLNQIWLSAQITV